MKLYKYVSLITLLSLGCGKIKSTTSMEHTPSEKLPTVIESIREETVRPSAGEKGYPLPLVSTWNTGVYHYTWPNRPRGSDPAWQVEQIEKGLRFLPTFAFPEFNFDEGKFADYLYPPFEKIRDYHLPFVLLASQWERHLTDLPEYLNLPPEKNPNVVTPEGEILKMVDPFGPTEVWYEVGKKMTSHPTMEKLQQMYPNPPKVIFLSNNEHAKPFWHEIEKSKRYLKKYGTGKADAFKRKVVGDAWIEKYRALQQGMRDGLTAEAWKKNLSIIAYGGDVGMEALGRWGGWKNYSFYIPGRFGIAQYMWDGVSPSYYMAPYTPVTDYQVVSNQIEAMNSIFALKEAFKINPNFWYELSIWDGDVQRKNPKWKSKWESYREAGQTYDMARFAGWLQYGLWLRRPRVLRLYEDWIAPLEGFKDKLKLMGNMVDRVHANEVLRTYWRKGELVQNKQQQHPYQVDIPNDIAIQPRWFLLDVDVNPVRPWELETEISVFSLAYILGEAPHRSWLIYAHAPLKDYQNVEITIPEYEPVRIDVPREGIFYEVKEADGSVQKIDLVPLISSKDA